MKDKRKEVDTVRGAWAIARVSFSEGKRESFAIGKPRLPQSCGPVRKNDNAEVPLLGPNNGPKPPQKTSVAQCAPQKPPSRNFEFASKGLQVSESWMRPTSNEQARSHRAGRVPRCREIS